MTFTPHSVSLLKSLLRRLTKPLHFVSSQEAPQTYSEVERSECVSRKHDEIELGIDSKTRVESFAITVVYEESQLRIQTSIPEFKMSNEYLLRERLSEELLDLLLVYDLRKW